MIVTDIQEVSSSKVKVYIDEEFAFVLYKGEIRKYGIKADNILSQKVYEELMGEVLPKRAKLRCMNLLKSRDYTVSQLKQKLKQGNYPEAVIEEALAYVASFHYTDDCRYAQDFINTHYETRSRRKIENDLLGKGITKDVIIRAWAQWEEEGNAQDEDAQIAQLLNKKHFDPENADQREMQRIYGFLARRGFSAEKILKAMSKTS
ncbi:MAG: regulatory protein RecX [Lachnospiraceae bacterium]|nr:regulatory protein RecX [Lachnospiraceae bacterium]MBQ7780725.1 regulatory protein RecX [Lachnospiraceae bacterium]